MSIKTDTEKEEFIYQEFKDSITKQIRRKNKTYFKCNWKSPNGRIICRKSWCKLYDIPICRVENCSKRLKEFPEARRDSLRPYIDEHLHNYSYDEVEKIFTENLGECGKS